MSLFDKLRDPDNFNISDTYNSGVFTRFGSKSIKFGTRKGEPTPPSFHLVDRVQWFGDNQGPDGHEPTFSSFKNPANSTISDLVEGVFSSTTGVDHRGNNLVDFSFRGGVETNLNRREIDAKRINQFLYNSPQGSEFLARQAGLQLLNPLENTRTFNGGASLLAQIMAAGTGINFKRHGLIPEPAGTRIGANIDQGLDSLLGGSLVGGAISSFVGNIVGGDYISSKQGIAREKVYETGDPGKAPTAFQLGLFQKDVKTTGNPLNRPPRKSGKYNVPLERSPGVDQINLLGIFSSNENGTIPQAFKKYNKDFCPFRFEVIDHDNPLKSNFIVFRAFLMDFKDNFNTRHNTITYNGRGEEFYTYNNFTRTIGVSFKIATQSRHEMKPLYKKLNYLAAQSAPNYSQSGRIRTPYMKLTVGDYFYRLPGVLSSINISWNKDYPWEIKLDKGEPDSDMLILPQILDVSISFKIH